MEREKLPLKVAKDVSEDYDLDEVIVIASSRSDNKTYFVTYGKTKLDAGFAALDGAKIHAMLDACPTSLEEAVEAAQVVRPNDIQGVCVEED